MGIVCAWWREHFVHGGARKLLIVDHLGNELFNALPAGMGGLERQTCVDPVAERAYVFDNTDTAVITVIDLSSGNEGDVLDTWDWTPEWGAISVRFFTITNGGYLLGVRRDAGDGKLYILKTDLSIALTYNLCDTDLMGDLKLTPDKAYLYIINQTDKRIHKLAVQDIDDFADQAAFEAACEWTIILPETPRHINLETVAGDIVVTCDVGIADVEMNRVDASNGAVIWSKEYGYGKVHVDAGNSLVFACHGGTVNPEDHHIMKVDYADGSIDSQIENDATVASKVVDCAKAHDQSVIFVGAHDGHHAARLSGVAIPGLTLDWSSTWGTNPVIRLWGDPTGYYYQLMANAGADEPAWADLPIIIDITPPKGAELKLHTALIGYAGLGALVDIRVYNMKFPTVKPRQWETSFPCCVFQRIFTNKEQVITGAAIGQSVGFQIACYSESSVEATTVALQVESALVDAIGSFIDVTMKNESADWNPDAELYSHIVECECLEAA